MGLVRRGMKGEGNSRQVFDPDGLGQHLAARVRPPRRISQVNAVVDEFTQTQVLGEGDREEQPYIGHQAVVVEGDLNAVGMVKW